MAAPFMLLTYGRVREYWLLQGYEENDLDRLWDAVEKVETRRCGRHMVNPEDPNHRVRMDSKGRQFEILAKIPTPPPSDPMDEVPFAG